MGKIPDSSFIASVFAGDEASNIALSRKRHCFIAMPDLS
jgi:hypothetical protein